MTEHTATRVDTASGRALDDTAVDFRFWLKGTPRPRLAATSEVTRR